jgi:CRISPR-associated protein Cas2
MRTKDFLICYDISDTKRLAKMAKLLEKESIRIQKSQFFYLGASKQDMINLVNGIKDIVNKDEDDVRVYQVNKDKSLHLNKGINLKQPTII